MLLAADAAEGYTVGLGLLVVPVVGMGLVEAALHVVVVVVDQLALGSLVVVDVGSLVGL